MEKQLLLFIISVITILNNKTGFSLPTIEALKNNTVDYKNHTTEKRNEINEDVQDRVSNMGKIFNCGAKVDMNTCLKARLILYIQNLSKAENISLIGSTLTLSRATQNSSNEGRSLFSKEDGINSKLPEDQKSRNEVLDNLLVTGITKFMRNYVIQLRLPEWSLDSVENSLDEGRQYPMSVGEGKKHKKHKGGMVFMMPHDDKHHQMMLLMMKAMMIKMALAAIAAMAGKALLMSVVSFVISSIIGLKKLSHNQGETKVEIVKYPVHSSHGGQHYDRRTLDDDYGQHLAYKGQNWEQ
ncbi:hypothetical protein C0J52_16942 [Blattella germanica]|nr:hypothetical protein C0J52_16942 [Blattella germanica]